MHTITTLAVVFSVLSISISIPPPGLFGNERTYYWRDYTGKIPRDAFVVATNPDGKVYAGQAYQQDIGVMVGQIVPGVPTLTGLYGGLPVLDKQVKVLCGASHHFSWLKTNSSDLHRVVTTLPVVLAGYQVLVDSLYFGRTRYPNGEVKLGKIHEVTNLMYVENIPSQFDTFTEYEILLYKPGKICNVDLLVCPITKDVV